MAMSDEPLVDYVLHHTPAYLMYIIRRQKSFFISLFFVSSIVFADQSSITKDKIQNFYNDSKY